MLKHNFIFLFLLLLSSCQSEKDKLLKEGYQVFEKHHFAIKCPCVLKKEVYPNQTGKRLKELEHYECIAKSKNGTNELTYMVQFLPNEARTPNELSNDYKEFIRHMKSDVESIKLSSRNEHDVLLLKYSPFFYNEIYLKSKMTYYVGLRGINAHKTDSSFFSTVAFFE